MAAFSYWRRAVGHAIECKVRKPRRNLTGFADPEPFSANREPVSPDPVAKFRRRPPRHCRPRPQIAPSTRLSDPSAVSGRAKPRRTRASAGHAAKSADFGNGWLGREDSNLRMAESKSAALPLGDAPMRRVPASGRTIVRTAAPRKPALAAPWARRRAKTGAHKSARYGVAGPVRNNYKTAARAVSAAWRVGV